MIDVGSRLGALRFPLYRRFAFGAAVTSVGHWAVELTVTWTVLSETGSAASGGLVLASLAVPMLITGLPAGTLTDRIGPRAMMILGQSIATAGLVIAATLAAGGHFGLAAAIGLAILLGASDGLGQVPAQVLIPRLVESRLMASAIALSALPYAAGRLVGGFIGGVGLQAVGPAVSIGAAAVGFAIGLGVVWSLPAMRGLKGGGARVELADVREVLSWLRRTTPVLVLFGVGVGASIFAYTYFYLLPVVSRDLVEGGASGLGLMTMAAGIAYIVAAFSTEPLGRRFGYGRVFVCTLGAAALAIGALAVSRSLVLSVAFAGIAAGLLTVYSSITNFLIQALAPPELRGRLVALFTVMFWGIQPLASIGAGVLADWTGVEPVLLASSTGTLLVVGAVAFAYRPLLGLAATADGSIELRPVARYSAARE